MSHFSSDGAMSDLSEVGSNLHRVQSDSSFPPSSFPSELDLPTSSHSHVNEQTSPHSRDPSDPNRGTHSGNNHHHHRRHNHKNHRRRYSAESSNNNNTNNNNNQSESNTSASAGPDKHSTHAERSKHSRSKSRSKHSKASIFNSIGIIVWVLFQPDSIFTRVASTPLLRQAP